MENLEQSLPLCCSLAALGGVMETAATAVTAVPAVRAKAGIKMSWWLHWSTIFGNVLLQGMGSIIGHLFSTWFGPVSLVVPFFFSATLLSNMVIVRVLGEHFTKNMRVGTLVIVVSVILLPVIGPTTQDNQDIALLMRHWYSRTWFALLFLASAGTGLLLTMDITKYDSRKRVIILLVARASSLCVNLTVSRAFIMGPSGIGLIALIIIKILTGCIYTSAIVVQSFAVEQSQFVPMNATLIIVLNAITGIIIWEDWLVVQSWYGYACVFYLLGLGCDLLLSVPMLNNENPDFGMNNRASIFIPSVRKRRVSTLVTPTVGKSLLSLQSGRAFFDEFPDVINESTKETAMADGGEPNHGNGVNNQDEEPPERVLFETPMPGGNRRVSRVEAWKEILTPTASRSPNDSIGNGEDSNLTSHTRFFNFGSISDQSPASPTAMQGGRNVDNKGKSGLSAGKVGSQVMKVTKQIGTSLGNSVEKVGHQSSKLPTWREIVTPMKRIGKQPKEETKRIEDEGLRNSG